MAEVDYFSNHRLKLRFPFRLYHAPIVAALERVVSESHGTDVLNIGSGPFFELETLRAQGKRFSICDIDSRAIELAMARYGSRLSRADVLDGPNQLPYSDASFDTVVSMEVIEHVTQPLTWLREALRVLKPGGQLFLTTPNYGSYSLRLIETTALEAVARLQGFSRRQLHPNKLDQAGLAGLLQQAGVRGVRIEPLAFSWVLSARGNKS